MVPEVRSATSCPIMTGNRCTKVTWLTSDRRQNKLITAQIETIDIKFDQA